MESLRSAVSSKWAATSRTFHKGAIVCSSHCSGAREVNRAIKCSSTLLIKGAHNIGSSPADRFGIVVVQHSKTNPEDTIFRCQLPCFGDMVSFPILILI